MPKYKTDTINTFTRLKKLSFNREYSTTTFLCKDPDDQLVIIKTIQASDEQAHQVEREIKCHETLNSLICFDMRAINLRSARKGGIHKERLTRQYTIVSEFIPGEDLDHFVAGKEFCPEEWLSLLYNLTLALQRFHEQGFAHRDVKPDNFILNPEGIHATDYGHSILKRYASQYYSIGLIKFAAPEVLSKLDTPAINDQDSDITSLGYSFLSLLNCIEIKGLVPVKPDFKNTVKDTLEKYGFKPEQIEVLLNIFQSMFDTNPKERPSPAQICKELLTLSDNIADLSWITSKDYQPLAASESTSKTIVVTSKKMTELTRHGYADELCSESEDPITSRKHCFFSTKEDLSEREELVSAPTFHDHGQ